MDHNIPNVIRAIYLDSAFRARRLIQPWNYVQARFIPRCVHRVTRVNSFETLKVQTRGSSQRLRPQTSCNSLMIARALLVTYTWRDITPDNINAKLFRAADFAQNLYRTHRLRQYAEMKGCLDSVSDV